VTDDFNRAGISHLVAISGYNVLLVTALGLAALRPLAGRRRAIVVSMLLVVLFALLVGGSPSVLRAALMGLILLGAKLAGRPDDGLSAVWLTAALLGLWQPLIFNDVAFQLSFAATLGLVLLARPLQTALAWSLQSRLPGPAVSFLAESGGVTLAASLATLPIVGLTFDRVSLVALPANLLAGFAFPLILASSALTAIAGTVSDGLGRLAGEAAFLPLAYLIAIGRLFGGLPGASMSVGRLGPAGLIALAALSGCALGLWLNRSRFRFGAVEPPVALRFSPVLVAAALIAAVAVVAWWRVLDGDSGRLTVTVLDVGQGDAILMASSSPPRPP
jgi:competence protein ComEC